MSTTSTGRRAEAAAAAFLEKLGYKILDKNWRTRWCEIDIIAEKYDMISFIEVKYRASDAYGSGLEYITVTKQKQMAFAAEFWVAAHHWEGEYHLAAIAVTGKDFVVSSFLDEL